MVPEFMHRDFYRSEEGLPIAFPASATPPLPRVPESPRQLPFPKAGVPRKQVRFVERSPHPEPPPEVPKTSSAGQTMQAKEPGPLLPLRSTEAERRPGPEGRETGSAALGQQSALRATPNNEERPLSEPESSRGSGSKKGEGARPESRQRSWSPALAAVLLVLLSLVIWREQTYRELLVGEQLPLPVTIPEPVAAEPSVNPLDGVFSHSLGPLGPDQGAVVEEDQAQSEQAEGQAATELESLMGGTSPAADPGDLFPVAATVSSTQAPQSKAPGEGSLEAPASGSAQDRQLRLQSTGLFPQTTGAESSSPAGTTGAPSGGTKAGSEAASLFPAVEARANNSSTAESLPQLDSAESSGFPAVAEPARTPAPPAQARERAVSDEPLTLPPPVLPESLPASTPVAPIGEPSQYHISEPTF